MVDPEVFLEPKQYSTHELDVWELPYPNTGLCPALLSLDAPQKKYINIPSEKYIYVHIYVYVCVYT